jgi:hypothetical protein
MKELHHARYPFTNNELLLIKQFTDFSNAEYDFDPVCLRNKHWEIIKLDFLELIRNQK